MYLKAKTKALHSKTVVKKGFLWDFENSPSNVGPMLYIIFNT